ncbi:MAG: fructose-bisphosphate aldolase class I [Gammaproteobacteria bacterium]|nr:fructose-bisphosphate aldolase class I [Gammaproteobacteria bacterium]
MLSNQELAKTIDDIVKQGKGILAADESTGTITKRFQPIKVESTEENRRIYRELLFTTPSIQEYISGVILYEETLSQKTHDGNPFPKMLQDAGIVPGIKVDKGIIPLSGSPEENITQGLDGLEERLKGYKALGARFAKWRAVIPITAHLPSQYALHANAEALARYASICQAEGIVPIVEPEVLMDGNHSLQRCAEVTELALREVFNALYLNKVKLEYIILKPNMVVPGTMYQPQASVDEVAEATLKVLRRTVPAAVPSINFLSGGQTDELATAHLNAMNHTKDNPWCLSFSYGRALQAPALKKWSGQQQNISAAQEELLKRARLNSAASKGAYTEKLEA